MIVCLLWDPEAVECIRDAYYGDMETVMRGVYQRAYYVTWSRVRNLRGCLWVDVGLPTG